MRTASLEERRYTTHETADKCSVSIATIWRWMNIGVGGNKLRYRKVGGRRFVFDSDLESFLAVNNGESPLAVPADPDQPIQPQAAAV